MESAIGIKGKNFVVLASEKIVARSILILKNDHEKVHTLRDKILLTGTGDNGDATAVFRNIKKVLTVEQNNYQSGLNIDIASNKIQNLIHQGLRRRPLQSNFLVAGKKDSEYKLTKIDMYGTIEHDSEYRDDMSVGDAVKLIEKCYKVLKERCVVKVAYVDVKVMNEDGVQTTTLVV